MLIIEVKRYTCNDCSRKKSLQEIIVSNSIPNCGLQGDDPYIIGPNFRQMLSIESTEELKPIHFLPHFIDDLSIFPIYSMVFYWPSRLFAISEFIIEIEKMNIEYNIFDRKGRTIADIKEVEEICILFKIEKSNEFELLFNDYLSLVAADNHFVGFWIGGMPCFSWYPIKFDPYDEPYKVLIDFPHFFATIGWDASRVLIMDKNASLNYETLKKQLKSLTIKQFDEVGYDCC
ncbi:hypothetical protein [Fischerella thermalis]|uniref:hypothetical protein n=1 Tax=Fischerella thermalis TaxID=372787 RepID=UPI000C7FFCB5|nr:hypothetical protein [Fischerella thermalis]PLZ81025.1 hypothetical protein CBP20_10005 [Fischerella thermalis WC213]